MLITIILIQVLHNSNLIPLSITPINKVISHLAGQIFIDNTDLNTRNTGEESKEELVSKALLVLSK